MPSSKQQVKRETRVDKISPTGRLKSTELPVHGRIKDTTGAPLARFPSGSQSRSGVYTGFTGFLFTGLVLLEQVSENQFYFK